MSAGEVFIPGVPRPQGSARAFVVKGRAVVTGANAKTNPWRADVHAAVRAKAGDTIAVPTGPVCIALEFVMPRRAAEKRIAVAHTRKPDLDKLVRAGLDSICGLILTDDAQVDVLGALKRTAEIGEQPGMWLRWSSGEATTIEKQAQRGRQATRGPSVSPSDTPPIPDAQIA